MSDETLNRNEVEELLKQMGPANQQPSDGAAADLMSGDASAGTARAPGPRQRVTAYDFKRPERVGKDQMRALQSLHEGFSRNFGASMSALLRTIVECKLISVDQLTYSEFVYSLEIPTCLNLLRPKPLEGNWILDLSPSILYPIIDRMLGGTPSPTSTLKRPLSEIELRLTSRITSVFFRELSTAWENTVKLEFDLERTESNPQLVQIVPPNEVVVLISFEITMGKSRGMVNMCIPFNSIERIGSKLTNSGWIGYANSKANDESKRQIQSLISESHVELVVSVARSTIKAAELINLQVGDIVTTEKDIHSPLSVEIAGVGKFHGKPGSFKGRKAIEILGAIQKESFPTRPNDSEQAAKPSG